MTFPTDAAIITRRKSLGISIAMCGSCYFYFKALPRIFQRFIFLAEQGSCATFTGANCGCVRNAWPQGNFEPLEESSNGLRHREPPLPPSHLSGNESAESSIIPNRTPTLSDFWLNRTE